MCNDYIFITRYRVFVRNDEVQITATRSVAETWAFSWHSGAQNDVTFDYHVKTCLRTKVIAQL
jgi:hypothetical protein